MMGRFLKVQKSGISKRLASVMSNSRLTINRGRVGTANSTLIQWSYYVEGGKVERKLNKKKNRVDRFNNARQNTGGSGQDRRGGGRVVKKTANKNRSARLTRTIFGR